MCWQSAYQLLLVSNYFLRNSSPFELVNVFVAVKSAPSRLSSKSVNSSLTGFSCDILSVHTAVMKSLTLQKSIAVNRSGCFVRLMSNGALSCASNNKNDSWACFAANLHHHRSLWCFRVNAPLTGFYRLPFLSFT